MIPAVQALATTERANQLGVWPEMLSTNTVAVVTRNEVHAPAHARDGRIFDRRLAGDLGYWTKNRLSFLVMVVKIQR